jgi:hypothetical protein
MAKKTRNSPSTADTIERQGDVTDAAEGLARLREIIFGAASREIEQRLARIEAHLAARADELLQELRRRTEMIEGRLRHEAETLSSRLDKEHASQVEAMTAASRETHEAVGAIDQRLDRLEDGLAQALREGRKQILDQAHAFLDELHRVRGEMTVTIERELALARGEEPAAGAGDGHERVAFGQEAEEAPGR